MPLVRDWSFTIYERPFIRSSCNMVGLLCWPLRDVTVCLRGCVLEMAAR